VILLFGFDKSEKEFLNSLVPMLKKDWITEARRLSEFNLHIGKDLKPSIVTQSQFVPIWTYIEELYMDLYNYKLKMKWIDEIQHWEEKGGLCIMLSVLTYALFQKTGVANEQEMRFVQGYYQHKSRTDSWIVSMLPQNHIGLHAWITIQGAVVDISIRQEEQFFDFGSTPFIAGKVPEGMTMTGFSEPKKTVNKYIELFAKKAKLSPEQWLDRHLKELANYTDN
jgi:hypothetical protein